MVGCSQNLHLIFLNYFILNLWLLYIFCNYLYNLNVEHCKITVVCLALHHRCSVQSFSHFGTLGAVLLARIPGMLGAIVSKGFMARWELFC